MSTHMIIYLGSQGNFSLSFKIRKTPIAQLWLARMQERHHWPMDHPNRFYGFGSSESERTRAIDDIQRCISVINQHEPIIHRPFEYTQDCLNYLHNIFERYHGLLDQQTSDYWNRAPDQVKKALAELNLAVHRCESVASGSTPRFVCTWFGMPKIHKLNSELQSTYGSWKIEFGTVYLNYCEIGKTVEDLTKDNDQYIGDDAFKPFSHYSADFNVQFHDKNLSEIYGKVQNYIDQNRDFFLARGITSVYNVKAQPLRFPVADLIYDGDRKHLLTQIAQHQCIYQIDIK